MKYKFPSNPSTHIKDENGNTVLEVPMLHDECEQAWRTRRGSILKWLNDEKICFPVEKQKGLFKVGDIVRSRNNPNYKYKVLRCDEETADLYEPRYEATYKSISVVLLYLDK